MGKQISAIKFIGTVGNLVGSKGLDSKVIIREKPASVSNPQTVEQMNQRARFKLATKVSAMLGEVGQLALVANGFKSTRRGTLTKDVLAMVELIGEQEAGLARQLNLVKNPALPSLLQDVTISVTKDTVNNKFTATMANLPNTMISAKAMLIYDKTTGQWINSSALDTNNTMEIGVQNINNCDVYFYAELVLPSTSAGSAKLLQLIAANPGYTVSVARLAKDGYKYSRTYNAGIVDGVTYSDIIPADQAAIDRDQEERTVANATNYAEVMQRAIDLGLRPTAAEDAISVVEEFVKLNKSNFTANSAEPTNPGSVIISKGNLIGVGFDEPDLENPLTVSVDVSESRYVDGYNSAEDKVFVVVYNKDLHEMFMDSTARGNNVTTGSINMTVPSFWQGTRVEMYGFVIGADDSPYTGMVSNTTYLGAGTIA